jgi:hypothetical protein
MNGDRARSRARGREKESVMGRSLALCVKHGLCFKNTGLLVTKMVYIHREKGYFWN